MSSRPPDRKPAAKPGRSAGNNHLDRELLLEHAEGGPLAAPARAHLDGCAPCRESLQATVHLVEDLRAPALAEPAESLVLATVGLFPARPPLAARILEALGRLVRIENPGMLLATAGVRGGGVAAPLRMLFAHEALEVDVEVTSGPAGRRVTGQALGPAGARVDGLVWAERSAWRSAEAPVGAHGMFQLEGLPDGKFDLVFDLGDRIVRFEARPTE